MVRGVVTQILSGNRNHPYGVLVKLDSGEIGRAKKIVGGRSQDHQTAAFGDEPQSYSRPKIADIVAKGESHHVEFKSDILWSAGFSADDIRSHRPQSKELGMYGKAASKIIIAKSLAGFLNSDGGTLVVGVREDKVTGNDEVIGIEREFTKLKDQSRDGYRRMIVDLVKDYFPSSVFNHLNDYLQIGFEKIGGMEVCAIHAVRSDRRVFLSLKNSDHYFIRTDASTRELFGEEIVEYCQKRFT